MLPGTVGTKRRRSRSGKMETPVAGAAGCLVGVTLTALVFVFVLNPEDKSSAAVAAPAAVVPPAAPGTVAKPAAPAVSMSQGVAADNLPFEPAIPLGEDLGSPQGLIVMVPYSSYIDPKVEDKLRYLQNKGFQVLRRQGAALDNICSAMASQVLRSGWKELLWIDASVDFDLGGIGLARNSGKNIVGAVYPSSDGNAFATHFLPGTTEVQLGANGGLVEVQHTGMGFLYVKAQVFTEIKQKLGLPDCNEGFEDALVPYFKSFVGEKNGKPVYLVHHRAFCERARQAGIKVYVDTRIRANTVGPRPYLWEDVVHGGVGQARKQITANLKTVHEDFV